MNNALPVYIGYDPREDEAYEVCKHSLLRRSSIPLHVIKLDQPSVRKTGLYERQFVMDGNQKIDVRDGKPFSTDFSFTRFLVPALSLYTGWSIFCDCDFLFTGDIERLMSLADPQYAVMVVKHVHIPKETWKMDGQIQTRYHRKNWSSMILWNNDHPANKLLTTNAVNVEPGSWLHAFGWLHEAEMGELPETWNWLSGVSDPLEQGELPCAIHYTLGGPWFENYRHVPYAALWNAEKANRSGQFDR